MIESQLGTRTHTQQTYIIFTRERETERERERERQRERKVTEMIFYKIISFDIIPFDGLPFKGRKSVCMK